MNKDVRGPWSVVRPSIPSRLLAWVWRANLPGVLLLTVLLTPGIPCSIAVAMQPGQIIDDTLRVLTYNLHGLLEDGPNPDWDSVRTAWLLDAIEDLDPDIVGFQEVLQTTDSDGSDNQIRTLADSLTRRTGSTWEYSSSMAHPSWERFDEGVAILSRHPILLSREYMLEAKDVFRRNALAARIRTRLGEINFFTTHLAHRAEAESVRMAQVAEIKRRVKEEGETGVPAIVVGDFNAEPDRPSIGMAVGKDSKGSFVDAYARLHPDENGFTYPADKPARRIDYVFVTESSGLIPVRAEVLFDRSVDGFFLSDHLGVLVEFVASPDLAPNE